jgi:hypothetical protein
MIARPIALKQGRQNPVKKAPWGVTMAINAYNSAVRPFETPVLVSARWFKDLGATPIGSEIAEVLQIETFSRLLQATELLGRDKLP